MSNSSEQLKDFFRKRNQEASWCHSCVRRNTCTDKETVAMEEHLAYHYTLKHVNVKAECLGYIKDSNVKDDPRRDFFGGLFN